MFQPQGGMLLGGTWATPVLTLLCDTTGMSNSDRLLIYFDDSLNTTAISASTLPLPTGASTSALQTSGNSTLTGISDKLPGQLNNKIPVIPANVNDSVSDNINDLSGFTTNITGDNIFQIDGESSITPSYAVFSLDPLTQGVENSVTYNATFKVPFHAALGISLSQRVVGQEFSVEHVSNETAIAPFTPVSISSISQTTTTLSATTSTNHNLVVGQSISIMGVTNDSRLNYPSLVVASIPSSNQFTATAGPSGTIPSLTVGPFTNVGTVYSRSRLGGAKNGISMIFENTTATNASYYARANSGDALPGSSTANYIANHSTIMGTTASVAPISAAGVYGFQPSNNYDFIIDPFSCLIGDRVIDIASAVNNTRLLRNQLVPDPTKPYYLRIRGSCNSSLTVPIAKIVSASKSGTTTATINTDVAHNLTTGDYVNIYGIRDTTNFGNRTAATVVSSVVSSTSFTIVIPTTATATSYGGYVSRVNGSVTQQGAVTMVAQSVSRTSNLVTVIGSAAWSGFVIGDYVNLHGVYDTSGVYLNLDGPYRVYNISTTTLVLQPIGSAPTGADITSTNCGGSVIKRTDLRLHYYRAHEYQRLAVESYGGGYARGDYNAGQSVIVSNIAQGNITTFANAAPLVIQPNGSTSRALVAGLAGPTTNTDYSAQAWAAVSGSGAVIANAQGLGGAATFDVNLTAWTAGASTGLDVYLQESPDNGTTYYDIWQCETLTAVGRVRIPAIPINGRRRMRWVNRGGAATTATVTVTAMDVSTTPAKQVQWFDRTIGVGSGTAVLDTNSAAYDISGTKLITVVMFAGTATAIGTFQPWMSLDGTNWYVAGAATNIASTSANSTVLPITSGMVGKFIRVTCTNAGTSQVINAIHIYGTN